MKSVAALAVVAAMVGWSLSGTRAQQTTFRAGVDVVSLDVTVLDKSRRPVRGLTAGNFTVLEGGKPRPIVAFEEVVLPQAAIDPAAAPWLRDAPRDVVSNDPSEGRLVVIMFDHTISADTGRAWSAVLARTIANRIVDELGPGDLAAVVFTQALARPQNFTADKAALRHAIDSPVVGASTMTNSFFDGQCKCGLCSLNVIRQTAEAVRDVIGRRKQLFFIGREIVVNTEPIPDPTDCSQWTIPATAELFRAAQISNLQIHVLDPAGLLPPQAIPTTTRLRQEQHQQGSLQILAERTGGRAVFNVNQPQDAVPGLLREANSYYVIGFEADPVSAPANARSFHRIDVRVDRRGVDVHHRSGYYPPPVVASSPAGPTIPPLEQSLQEQLPRTGIPLHVSVAPMPIAGRKDAPLAIVLGLAPGAPLAGPIDVLTIAYDSNGRALGDQRYTVDLPRLDANSTAQQHEFLSRIDLPPGHYDVRFGVRHVASGAVGSVYTSVDVPDVRASALSMSGVVLESQPGRRAWAIDAVKALLPVVPTAQRQFSRAAEVRAFARVYQPESSQPKPVTVRASIVSASNRRVFDRAMAVTAAQFVNGAADCLLGLPLAELSTGAHLLTIEASSGKTSVARQVRFVVTR